jgi:hypothetical protein
MAVSTSQGFASELDHARQVLSGVTAEPLLRRIDYLRG